MASNTGRTCAVAIASIAVVATVLTACSGTPGPSIAHANAPAPNNVRSTTAGAQPNSVQKFSAYLSSERAFADCMRGLGLSVTDPDANGVQRAAYKDALRTNGKLSAAQTAGVQTCQAKLLPDPRPQVYPSESATEFRFDQQMAKCFRAHGVPGYPDPVRETDPSLPAVQHYDASIKQQPTATRTFQNALDTCSQLITGHHGTG